MRDEISDSGSVSSERRYQSTLSPKKRRSTSRSRKYKKCLSPNRWESKSKNSSGKSKWWNKQKKRSQSGWKSRQRWQDKEPKNRNASDGRETVKKLTLEALIPKKLYEHKPKAEPNKLSRYQTQIYEALLVVNSETPDLWRLVAFFLPVFNPNLLSVSQERLPSESGLWQGITVSNLIYDGKIAWKKETEFILQDGSNGSIHDARLLDQKQVLVVDETCWSYQFRKKGTPECYHNEYSVVSLLMKARIPF